jgi:hypothetical protein
VEWEDERNERNETSESEEEEPPTTAADRWHAGYTGANTALSEQISVCQRRWRMELPRTGAVSLSTMHDLQWHAGDLSDGDTAEWEEGGWRPWLGEGQGKLSPAQQKARGNKAFQAGEFAQARRLYTGLLDTLAQSVGADPADPAAAEDSGQSEATANVHELFYPVRNPGGLGGGRFWGSAAEQELQRSALLNRAACCLGLEAFQAA